MTAKESISTSGSLRVFALGGLNEYGKNLWVFEADASDAGSDKEYLVVDAGIVYPGYEHPGVDYVMPDFNFLIENKDKIKALVLTSSREAHCGCAEHLIKKCGIKTVVGSKLALELVRSRLESKADKITWTDFSSREPVKLSSFRLMPFTITSTTAEAYAVSIEANGKKVFYSGSYKIEQTPVDGVQTDLAGITAYTTPNIRTDEPDGGYGSAMWGEVDLYIADSANVEIEGYSASEMSVVPKFRSILQNETGRVLINTCNANTIRIQTMFKLAEETGRKVALLNKDAKQVYEACKNTGLIQHAPDTLISIRDIANFDKKEILIISTAPEGDALKELVLLANDDDLEFQLEAGDAVVNSADPPPGTVRVMAQICDAFFLKDVKIIGGRNAGVNIENHALTEEMKFMFNMVRPKFFAPGFGETRQLVRHAKLATNVGFPADCIFMLDNGDILELNDEDEPKVVAQLPANDIMFNHHQDFDIDEKVIKDRDLLSTEGLVTVSFTVSRGKIVAGPVFSAKATTFSKNKEWRAFCMINAPGVIDLVNQLTASKPDIDAAGYQEEIRSHMVDIIRNQIGKKPAVSVLVNQI